jgi:penicillin amidase
MNRKLLVILLLMAAGAWTACDDAEQLNVPNDVTEDSDTDEGDVPDLEDGETDGGETIDRAGPITDLRIEGMTGSCDVSFSDNGIPTIDCDNDADTAAVLGYLHARDRFVQMDIRRRLVQGRLSEIVIVPSETLPIDTQSRTLFTNREGRPIEEVLVENASEKTMELLEAYSNGVNAWIADYESDENGATLQAEYGFFAIDVSGGIDEWTPEDSMATVAALVEQLTNDASTDLSYGEQAEIIQSNGDLPAGVFADYFTPRPFSDSLILESYEFTETNGASQPAAQPKSNGAASRPNAGKAMREAREALDTIDRILGVAHDRGSNNWVVSGDLTASGNPLLTNDPHLTLSNPAIWYVAHLNGLPDGDYHSAGFTFAGLPWVIIGQNEDIAWGVTNTSFDFSDVYIEELTEDGSGVVFNGNDVPFTTVDFEFNLADGTTETRTARYVEHHGPVLSIDEEEGTAVSLRWTGNAMDTDVNHLTELMRASSVAEGRQTIADNVTSIGQNWVLIDTQGNIGWYPLNNVPRRPWSDAGALPFLPLNGDGSQEWDGFFDDDQLPQTTNPEKGYLATANNDMTGANLDGNPADDGHSPFQSYVAIGYRHERIVDLLEATAEHTIQTMLDTVGDTYSLVGENASPRLLELADRDSLSANAQALYDSMDNWNYTCPTGVAGADPAGAVSSDADEVAESEGCLAFHRVFIDSYGAAFDDEADANEWSRRPEVSSFMRMLLAPEELSNPDIFWDDVSTESETEEASDIIAQGFEDAATWLSDEAELDPADWQWGRVHTTVLRADLFDNFVGDFNSDPLAKDGGLYTVNVAAPSFGGGSLQNRTGASMRLVCEAPPEGVSCNIQLPGGQPQFRDDENYLSLVDEWLENEPTDLPFDPSDVTGDVITAQAPDEE